MTNERESLSKQVQDFVNSSNQSNRKIGVVYDVILDESNELVKQSGLESALVGAVTYRTLSDVSISEEDSLPIAYPLDKNFKTLPTRNELIELYEISKGLYGYRRTGLEINPTSNSSPNQIERTFTTKPSQGSTSKQYDKVQKTNINRSSEDKTKTQGFGNYFEPQRGIHKLKLYEGDTLLESRFGQSIRFSAYNNDEKTFSPTTIIRNGESPQNRTFPENLPVTENVNEDGSIILMSSGDYQLNFRPPIETKPDSFPDLPSKLVGNQILFNSDRVILSSKSAEMRFYSKKGFAFATDGDLTMDIKKGMEIFMEENFTLYSKDRIMTFDVGNAGKIYLGSNENDLEPMVKGNRLVFLLSELIQILGQAQYKTPSGPTAPGPTSVEKLQTLQKDLNSCLSRKTFTI